MKMLIYVLLFLSLLSTVQGQMTLLNQENNTEVANPGAALANMSQRVGNVTQTVGNMSQDLQGALTASGAIDGNINYQELNRRLWSDNELGSAVRDNLQNFFPGVTANTKFQFYGTNGQPIQSVGVYTDIPTGGEGRERIRNALLNGRLGDSPAVSALANAGFFDKAKNHPMFFDMLVNVSDNKDLKPAERVGLNVGYGNRPSQALKGGQTYIHSSPEMANDIKEMFIGDKMGTCITTDPKSGSTMTFNNLGMDFRDGAIRFSPDFRGRTPENPRNPGGHNFQYGSGNCNPVHVEVSAQKTDQRNVFNFNADVGGGGWTESSRALALAQKVGTNIFGSTLNTLGSQLNGMINSNQEISKYASLPNGVDASLGVNTWFRRNGLLGFNATSGFNVDANFNADVDLGQTIDKHMTLPGGIKASDVVTVNDIKMSPQGVGMSLNHADMLNRTTQQVTNRVAPVVQNFTQQGPNPQ